MGHAIGITRQYDAGALRKLARRVRLAWSVKRCAIGCIALMRMAWRDCATARKAGRRGV